MFGYTGCSALRLHISVVSLIHLSHLVGLFPPEGLHTTLKPIVVCKCGLHKSHPCARIHTSSQAHSERTHAHTHTLPDNALCHPTSGLHLSFTLFAMATWFGPLAVKESLSMMGNERPEKEYEQRSTVD